MRQVVSDALGDFSAIYDEDVEVVCVTRPQASTCKTFADQLISARQVPQLRWVQAANDPDAPSKVLPDHINAEVLAVLSNEIAEACEVLGVLHGLRTNWRSTGNPQCTHVSALSRGLCALSDVDHAEWRRHRLDSESQCRLGHFCRPRHHRTTNAS